MKENIKLIKYGKTLEIVLSMSIVFLIVISSAFASPLINVTKTAPKNIGFNESFEVKIHIVYNGDNYINATVLESPISNAVLLSNLSLYKYHLKLPKGGIYMPPPYYFWNISLKPHTEQVISYRLRANLAGLLVIGPTKVETTDNIYRSNVLAVNVFCNNNGICQPLLRENEATCPHDCHKNNRIVVKNNTNTNSTNGTNSTSINKTNKKENNNSNGTNTETIELKTVNNYTNNILLIFLIFILAVIVFFTYLFYEMNTKGKNNKKEWIKRHLNHENTEINLNRENNSTKNNDKNDKKLSKQDSEAKNNEINSELISNEDFLFNDNNKNKK